jgi:hypothetical protein
VRSVTKQITKRSKIIKDLYKNREIAIIKGMYNVATGVVEFH